MTNRTYGQYCGLARALDIVGDRWALLVVRELLLGSRRFGELREGLPGVATNLLTDRLRGLEQNGVVERRLDHESRVEYALTEWGEGLREPVEALIRWSGPAMATGRADGDAFRTSWLPVALQALSRGRTSRRVRRARFSVGEESVEFTLDEQGSRVEVTEQDPELPTLPPEFVLGVTAGMPRADVEREVGLDLSKFDQNELDQIARCLAP